MYPPRINVKIEAWGPTFWYIYHKIAISYDEEKANKNERYKKAYLIFYNNFDKILPCKKCSIHYHKLKKERKLINFIDSKEEFFKWSVDNHNIVNKRLKKKQFSLDEAKIKYNEPLKNNMIMKFMNYLFRLSLKYYNVGVIKKIINNIGYILPSQDYRVGLQLRLKYVNNMKKFHTSQQLRNWFRKNHQIIVKIKNTK